MGYFPVRYDSGVVINERKMFIRLATESAETHSILMFFSFQNFWQQNLVGIVYGNAKVKCLQRLKMDALFKMGPLSDY